MSQWANLYLFGIYPYICLSVFVACSLIRFDREQYTWSSESSQLLRRRQLMWGSNLFHVGMLIILVGHVGGLLTPIAVFDALGIAHATKQMMAIILGGTAGLVGLVGLLMLLHRRLFDRRILRNSSYVDIAVLVILLVQLLIGLSSIFVSLQHLDGGEMVLLMTWAQHIATLRPDAAGYVLGVSPVFKVHLVLGMTIFLIFPFTRLVHILSAPVWYLGRRGYQIVRTKRLEKA